MDLAKSTVTRCLTPLQRQRFHLGAEPPDWCHTKKLWPFDNPTARQPARWEELLPLNRMVMWIIIV
jgi:hypothetical protein